MANTNDFIDAICTVLNEKKDTWGVKKDAIDYRPATLLAFPMIAVLHTNNSYRRTDRKYARQALAAEVVIYYEKARAPYRGREIRDLVDNAAQWILKNQTLKGLTLLVWIEDAYVDLTDMGGAFVGTGHFTVIGEIDGLDIQDVGD